MKGMVARCVVLLAGVVVLHSSISLGQQSAVATYRSDPRLAALVAFFETFQSPAVDLAEDFLLAADRNSLDWRLLPSIAIVESGGGKTAMNNNILGWDSCRRSFPSARTGIHFVAARLAHSSPYRNEDLDGKLRTYNPRARYPVYVKRLMRRLQSFTGSATRLD